MALDAALSETFAKRSDLFLAFACNCLGRAYKDGFTTDRATGIFKLVGVHAAEHCLRPMPTALAKLTEECYSCERFYVVSELPDRMLLCSGCK